ncbi:class I SAM-dependent methyltransferase [Geobacter sulfurreducens]|uniref:class I SAM-dependent methyltransferase n=1 Tax=Geobacter sulfurreducens TaxID=35554 RepID=UPI001375F39A|nr:class I SAM-dependent methyltransferase [Geobacter sulfurreducens]
MEIKIFMTSKFKANNAYKDVSVARNYDMRRFTTLKGRFTDWLEKRAINNALISSNAKFNSKVLDIPCGTGRLSIYLASQGYNVIGVDISDSMVEVSRIKANNHIFKDKLEFLVSDATSLPFEESSFDCVVSLRLFGHVPPDIRTKMLTEFSRVSRGPLILTYYHSGSLQCKLRKNMRQNMDIPWYPVTSMEIEKELKQIGYTIVRLNYMLKHISETVVVLAMPAKY